MDLLYWILKRLYMLHSLLSTLLVVAKHQLKGDELHQSIAPSAAIRLRTFARLVQQGSPVQRSRRAPKVR
jgi:hypothetical protein